MSDKADIVLNMSDEELADYIACGGFDDIELEEALRLICVPSRGWEPMEEVVGEFAWDDIPLELLDPSEAGSELRGMLFRQYLRRGSDNFRDVLIRVFFANPKFVTDFAFMEVEEVPPSVIADTLVKFLDRSISFGMALAPKSEEGRRYLAAMAGALDMALKRHSPEGATAENVSENFKGFLYLVFNGHSEEGSVEVFAEEMTNYPESLSLLCDLAGKDWPAGRKALKRLQKGKGI